MKKIDSDNFLTLVKNYINCNLKQTNYALPMLKGYLMKRPLGKSTKKDYFLISFRMIQIIQLNVFLVKKIKKATLTLIFINLLKFILLNTILII